MKKPIVIAAVVVVGITLVLLTAVLWYPFIQQYRANAHLSRAKAYQLTGNWPEAQVELRKVIELRPNSEEAWQLLAWNYCYNVSNEFDQPEEKYRPIRRGIEIAVEAATKNPRSAQLHWAVGWSFFHRIGKAPESEQIRRLFAEDDELRDYLRDHIDVDAALGLDGKPDNFLIAGLWFSKASDVADRFGLSTKWMSLVAMHSYPAHSQTNFALAISNEGASRDSVVRAWQDAAKAWHEYGDREFDYAEGRTIRFNDFHPLLALWKELEEQKNSGQGDSAQISRKLDEVNEKLYWTDRYRTMINFGYWPDRCRSEQTEPWLAARRLMFEARQTTASEGSNTLATAAAGKLFENVFSAWEQILKDNPSPLDDVVVEELAEHARFYRSNVLHGEPLPDGFPLRDLIDQVEAALAKQESELQTIRNHNARGHPAGRPHGAK